MARLAFHSLAAREEVGRRAVVKPGLVTDLMRKLAVEQEACTVTVTHDGKIFDCPTASPTPDRSRSMPATRSRVLTIAAAVAVIFGLLTIVSGGRALFGGVDMGAVVPFVLLFNFAAGFAYVLAGIGLWRSAGWAPMLSIAIAVVTAGVFTAFLWHVWSGGAWEARTMAAMILRTGIWTVIAALALKHKKPI